MDFLEEYTQRLIEGRSQMIDQQVRSFLAEYNLPLEKEELRRKGYAIQIDFRDKDTFYVKLLKFVDSRQFHLDYELLENGVKQTLKVSKSCLQKPK